jgi:hypothetical protein
LLDYIDQLVMIHCLLFPYFNFMVNLVKLAFALPNRGADRAPRVVRASVACLCGLWCPVQCLVPARPARRGKVLYEISAAIPGDASRRERRFHRRRLFGVLCKKMLDFFLE